MIFNEKTAARLKAEQRRLMDRQSARLKQIGIHPTFTVSPVHVRVTDQTRSGARHVAVFVFSQSREAPKKRRPRPNLGLGRRPI
jgi:hypothetical protein